MIQIEHNIGKEKYIARFNIMYLKQQKLSVKIMGRGYACLDIRTHAKERDIIYLKTN